MNLDKVKQLQEFIDKQEKFTIEGYNGRHTNLEDFIKDFHVGDLSDKDNIYSDGEVMERGESRSLIDTLIVCKVHHNATVIEVLEIFNRAYKNRILKGHFCLDIDRVVLTLSKPNWSLCVDSDSLIDINLPDVHFTDLFDR